MQGINKISLDKRIKQWLKEDMPYGDITTEALFTGKEMSEAKIIAKEDGVLCGIEVFARVYQLLDESVECRFCVAEGATVTQGQEIGRIFGRTVRILQGERLALNLLQRLSGIATKARSYRQLVEAMDVRIVDTRKTTPGLRDLEKYAVRTGGCHSHRYSLSDAVMIKDNHIQGAGSIKKAVNRAQSKIPHTMKIEVEVETLEQLQEALDAGADIIMLDNMSLEMMSQAVDQANGMAILEASGNMTLERISKVAATGVDVISVGALTHSSRALDISLRFD